MDLKVGWNRTSDLCSRTSSQSFSWT